eukprot:3211617-Lingulodinium_polyedra.AAC.1
MAISPMIGARRRTRFGGSVRRAPNPREACPQTELHALCVFGLLGNGRAMVGDGRPTVGQRSGCGRAVVRH